MKTLACAVVVLSAAIAGAAEPPADTPELKELSRFVGTWDTKMTVKLPGPVASRTGTAKAEWIHGGRFLRQTYTSAPGDGLPGGDGSAMLTYDSLNRVYRVWSFDSGGNVAEAEGVWDADASRFTWTSKGDSSVTVHVSTFKADGTEEWTSVTKNEDGKVTNEATGTNTPKKK